MHELPPTIRRKSKAEAAFVASLTKGVAAVTVEDDSVEGIQRTCDAILAAVHAAWNEHAETPKLSSRSQKWWSSECANALAVYREDRSRENRRKFKRAVKQAKAEYYEERIAEACEKGKRVWDVVSWTKPRTLPMYKSLVHQGTPLVTLDSL